MRPFAATHHGASGLCASLRTSLRWSQVRFLPGPPSKSSTSARFSSDKQVVGAGYGFRYGVVLSDRVR